MKSNYDDREVLISEKLWSIIDTNKSQLKIDAIKKLQLDFFTDAIMNVYSNTNRENTYENYLSQSTKCFEVSEFQILKNENREEINFNEGMIVIANHLGSNKITKISKEELLTGLKQKEIDKSRLSNFNGFINDDPFLILLAGLIKTVCSFVPINEVKFSAALINFPFPISEVALDCNHFLIDREAHNQYSIFENQILNKLIEAKKENKIPVVIIFPEGGTSGKNDFKEPFSLNDFHTGYLKVAMKFSLPILPIVQMFNSDFNFFTSILKMETINKVDASFNSTIKHKMQKELDNQVNANHINFRS